MLDLSDLRDYDDDMQDLIHQPSLEALEIAAPSCDLCTLFCKDLSARLDNPESISLEDKQSNKYPIIIRGRAYNSLQTDWEYEGLYMLTVRWNYPHEMARCLYSVYADESQEQGKIVGKNLVAGRGLGAAEESVGVLKEWVRICDEEHGSCLPGLSPLPTRVIDVGDSGKDPRLFITNGAVTARYMTLSHCWGKKPLLTTTTKNVAEHANAIPLTALPKTFREAIEVTRVLGIQYIWIDSLCIIQDDGPDWERESAVMGDIYHNSYLTIAAAGSSDSRGGCFLPRSRDDHVPVKYSVRDENGDMRIGQVYIRPHIKAFPQLPDSVLHSRAWVLQEQLLSRRTVHFDTDQSLWECRETRYTEDQVPHDAYESLELKLQLRKEDVSRDFIWDWHTVVENFTARGITKGFDKLPALSGLARTLEGAHEDEYVAGLWRKHLPLGLLWRRERKWLREPAEGYRAPSWSWASLDGMIKMSDAIMKGQIDVLVEDLHAEVQPSTRDPRGQLGSGTLSITGLIKTADGRLGGDYLNAGPDTPGTEIDGGAPPERLRDQGVEIGMAWYGLREDDSSGSATDRVYCLQVGRRPTYVQKWYGLLLVPTGARKHEYRRVGMFEGSLDIQGHVLSETSWFDDGVEETITIV